MSISTNDTFPTTQDGSFSVERGNVVKDKSTGRKSVVRKPKYLLYSDFEFVCLEAHADGDFSYLCTNEYCRCYQ